MHIQYRTIATNTMPSAADEREEFAKLSKKELTVDTMWYVVNQKWFQAWKAYSKFSDDDSKDGTAGVDMEDGDASAAPRPEPIDNATLSLEEGILKKGLVEHYDYSLISKEAYELLVEWYGGGPHFIRKVISRGMKSSFSVTPTLVVELYPMHFEVFLSNADGEPDEETKTVMTFSSTTYVTDTLAQVTAKFGKNSERSRLWVKYSGENDWVKVQTSGARNMQEAIEGSDEVISMLLEEQNEQDEYPRDLAADAWRYELKEGDLIDGQDSEKKWYETVVTSLSTPPGQHTKETMVGVHFRGWSSKWDTNYNLFAAELLPLHTKVSDWRDFRVNDCIEVKRGTEAKAKWFEARVLRVDKGENKVLIRYSGLKEEPDLWLENQSERLCESGTHIKKKVQASSYSRGSTYSSSSSYSNGGGYGSYRSNSRGKPAVRGACGLSNLGNTCFMNSMLQCLSNCEPLTEYILSDRYTEEININNPLGMGGRMVEAYAGLMKEMWSGDFTSVVPQRFKSTIGQYAPQFAGYQQQDSQELMNFLLDGLHEDLNRVVNKPYTETVESNGRPDLVVAKESWDRHLMRNDSVIVDLIQGQLKSHVTCPDCSNDSITFDPYMSLSLPLPSVDQRSLQVLVVRRESPLPPQRLTIQVSKHGAVIELKDAIQEATGIRSEDLRVADVYSSRFFKWLQPKDSMMSIRDKDVLYAYELLPQPEGSNVLCSYMLSSHDSTYTSSTMMGSRTSTRSGLFLPPLLLSMNGTISCLDMRQHCWDRVAYLIKPDGGFSVTNPPYKLRVTNGMGTTCGICPLSANCRGCEVPADGSSASELLNGGHRSLTLDWGLEGEEGIAEDKLKELDSLNDFADEESENEVVQLEDCFEKFVEREQLGADDPWYCPTCKDHKRAYKKFDLWSTPEVLVIQLKRFQYAQGTYFVHRDKISSLVQFPLEGLDLTQYVRSLSTDGAPEGSPAPIYDLFAVSEHSGGLGGGHYTAIAQNFVDRNWYNFNDSSCSPGNRNNCVSRQAYVLFYRRRKGAVTQSSS